MKRKLVNKTIKEVLAWASSFSLEQGREAHGAEWLFKERFDWTNSDIILRGDAVLSEDDLEIYLKDLKAYLSGEPAQYILGYTWFYGRKFVVRPDVLIPRPETEELVYHLLKLLDSEPKKILDIGTGSGIIAITIKKERPEDEVWATDISPEALEVAKENAEQLEADVNFTEGDLLEPLIGEKFDVIISNPPYIGRDEWDEMGIDVREHEPELALYAENEGYAIYERLAEDMRPYLKEKGQFFFEIGYRQGSRLQNVFQKKFPEKEILIVQDMQGMDRFIFGLNK